MCLLERVKAWDSDAILCSTDSHKDLRNPLRKAGGLSAVHGLEYGAQAMAVHGALLAKQENTPIRVAYIAAVHDLRLLVARLDTEQRSLQVGARCLLRVHENLIYNLLVEAGGAPLVTARVTVMPGPGAG